jgi:radical SAM superfamily enzyme YgiQ (UPF0313 family)
MHKNANNKIFKTISEDSPLYTYLATKEETSASIGVTVDTVRKSNFVDLETWHKNTKVLLINPPRCVTEGKPKLCVPPPSIAYIGAYLREVGINVELLDCIIEGWNHEELIDEINGVHTYGMSDEAIADYLAESKPEIIGLSLVFSQDLRNICKISKVAKKVLPNSIVIAGGLHPSIYPEQTFKYSIQDGEKTIDFILRGEGEHRLAEFVFNYQKGGIDKNQDGLVGYFDEKLAANPETRKIQDLDSLPLPAYDMLPMEKYFKINLPSNPFPMGNRVMEIHTSRGCPINCTFCSSTNYNHAFRARSPQSVYKEIKHYQDTFNIDEIQFMDDNLTLNSERAEKLFDAITPLKTRWCTPNGTMVITWKSHLMKKAIDSGIYQVTLSVDGLSKETHDLTRKPVDMQNVDDKINEFRKGGVLVHGSFVFGIPGETQENILKGMEWVKTLNFTSVAFYIAQPYPGAELYEVELAKGNITEEDGLRGVKTRSFIQNMGISSEFLETTMRAFTVDYEKIIKAREGEGWNLRYQRHLERLRNSDLNLIIGTGAQINMLIQADKMEADVETNMAQTSTF